MGIVFLNLGKQELSAAILSQFGEHGSTHNFSSTKSVSFWNGDKAIVVLTYYATHPQSYYRQGIANPDFPGMARFLRQVTLDTLVDWAFAGQVPQ